VDANIPNDANAWNSPAWMTESLMIRKGNSTNGTSRVKILLWDFPSGSRTPKELDGSSVFTSTLTMPSLSAIAIADADQCVRAELFRMVDRLGLRSFALSIVDGVGLKSQIESLRLTLSGLRCTEALEQGQFIDNYLGEVIIKEEADRRSKAAAKGKDSYLFTLDKFQDDLTEDPYEIDGEFVGGPSRFINHSCDPNCAVYAVCCDKNNLYQYDLAFFALRDIKPREELTFDYIGESSAGDEEGEEEISSSQNDPPIPCLCGSKNCRRILWK
jgi:hypothetical protein